MLDAPDAATGRLLGCTGALGLHHRIRASPIHLPDRGLVEFADERQPAGERADLKRAWLQHVGQSAKDDLLNAIDGRTRRATLEVRDPAIYGHRTASNSWEICRPATCVVSTGVHVKELVR